MVLSSLPNHTDFNVLAFLPLSCLLFDFLVTVKAAPHEYEIRTGQLVDIGKR